MVQLDENCFATLRFTLRWTSFEVSHTERYLARKVNMWRDIFPPGLKKALTGKSIGDTVAFSCAPGDCVPDWDVKNVKSLKPGHFHPRSVGSRTIEAKAGRFYPRGMLKGFFPEDITPFRVAELTDDLLAADLNHPLAGYSLEGEAHIENVAEKPCETGGRLSHWMEETCNWGPGMQARYKGRPTDFFTPYPLPRQDVSPDFHFYREPRLVSHVDRQAKTFLREEYARLIPKGATVLDLMAGPESHLNRDLGLTVTGLGLNEAELKQNPRLSGYLLHDLNDNPTLPLPPDTFDAAVCSLSVEYLTDPIAVFKSVGQVLKPGGLFIVSFSDRWFPPKVTLPWPDLHSFERVGFVLEVFHRTDMFDELQTLSIRNWWRPTDDPHIMVTQDSDPVFLVWGRRK